MIALSGCAEALFTTLPFNERIAAIAGLGLPAFEFWGFANKDIPGIRAAMEKTGLAVSSISCDTGGPLVDPSKRSAFLPACKKSIEVAHLLGCKTLIVTVGQEIPGVSRKEQHRSIVDGLKTVVSLVEDEGVTLVIEPLNVLVNHKGYFLATTSEGIDLVDEVASPNVKLLYDIYHQQITEGNLIDTIKANVAKIGHFHMADVPGRHEPGTGEINYEQVFRAIAETSYSGYIGLELWPTKPEKEALASTIAWAKRYFG
ncbi:MAG TPA: TIM barrel protein [Candidatus Latescibacteria bacterium]|nr:TIM barrel protein [Candidatus Latescibacterota bacterium]HQE61073.1 TIM barrel protein [Candidatus Latescibacterota bacterium]HQI76053.1 TIM barrel protein [Candidatus Latescibacterota bacterium]HQK22145.1 TIM barrel protein [Candidatus Latescibacterota bacterium]HRS93723.1 TIM barrel protein [Candidatus Latescibacterota bacterium]